MMASPLYKTLYDDLLGKIHRGTYPEGSLIPSEDELEQIYGVSRATVRHAVQLLVDAGYLEKRRRRGTMVCRQKVDQGFAFKLRSFESEMRANDRTPRTKVLALQRQPAGDEVSRALGISPDDQVFHLVRLRYADNVPNVFNESYVPVFACPTLDAHDFERRSLYAVMDESGVGVAHARRRLEVTAADSTLAALLGVRAGDPLFLFHTVGSTEDGRSVEYSVATYRGDSNAFEFEISR